MLASEDTVREINRPEVEIKPLSFAQITASITGNPSAPQPTLEPRLTQLQVDPLIDQMK